MGISRQHTTRRLRLVIPNIITIAAILAGYIAILKVFQGDYMVATALILFASVLDMLDGSVARAINATSDFGVEFDSLADLINYGVAPSVLFYFLYFHNWGMIGIILSFLPIACGGIRLARFNTTSDPDIPTKYYIGLPTTVSAVVLMGFVIFIHSQPYIYNAPLAATLVTVLVSVLMVSDVQYDKSNILSLRYILKTRRVITGALIILSLVLLPEIAFFAWGLLYIMYGATRSAIYTIWYKSDSIIEIEIDELA
jgi:CDP-diacylglycerol---serine O-phosphatidyltransferase